MALKAEIDNWRWAGVPFYFRTGKRMASRVSEICIQFRAIPHSIFDHAEGAPKANKLIIRLQPDEGVKLMMMIKDPGPGGMRLREVPLNLSFAQTFAERTPEAYERLLLDVIRGSQTLFMRRDELEAAWTLGRSDPRGLGPLVRADLSPILPAPGARPARSRSSSATAAPGMRMTIDGETPASLRRPARTRQGTGRAVATDITAAIAPKATRRHRRHWWHDAGQVLQALGKHKDIDWTKVIVTLVDERWVDETSDRSNALLVNEKMLQGPAAVARFVPLYTGGDEPTRPRSPRTNKLLADLPQPVCRGGSRHGQ